MGTSKKYYPIDNFVRSLIVSNMEDSAKKIEKFEKDFKINKLTNIGPMTGKERRISTNKICEKCVVERMHRECEKRAVEVLFQYNIYARSDKLQRTFNVSFCEINPKKIIEIIYSWNEFVYYIQTNDLIVEIFNDPKYLWWPEVTTQTMVMIHRKFASEAYMENEIIRFHDYKDGSVSKYRVGLTAMADKTPGTFVIGRSKIFTLPPFEYNGFMGLPALI